MGHRRRVVLTGRIPTVEEVAKIHGVSRSRVEWIKQLIDSFHEQDARRRRAARLKKRVTPKRGRGYA
jgi:transposase-like protein